MPRHRPRGGQVPLPKGGSQKWDRRDYGSRKFLTNHRNMLLHMLNVSERKLVAAIAGGVRDPELAEVEQNLYKQYNKLVFLDQFDMFMFDEKDGVAAWRMPLNDDQIQHNKELRAAESAPPSIHMVQTTV